MSGKQSKKVRREKKVSKKVVAGAAAAIIGTTPLLAEGGEFLISIFPHFSFPVVKFDESLSTGFGAGLQLTYRPNQYFNIFLQGDYKQYNFDTKENIGNISLMGASVGGGYHLPITDRLGIDFNASIGYYNSNFSHGSAANKKSSTVQGLNVSGGVFVSYKINPTISVFAGASANHYAYKNSKFITSADVNPGLTFNLTKAFSNKTNISVSQEELKPVFPVFYSWYNDNPFGCVQVTNNEDVTITDVNVYFFQPQYMSQPKECGKAANLKQGESLSVDLRAFFNEQMLELNEKNDTMSTIVVEYKYLGKKQSASFPMVVPVYGRNNMSWEDDRCASAFVSSKDPAAMWFAKYVVSTIRENIRSGLTSNIQYAMGIFDALDQFGINYVKDPTSAFEDNVGTASIDFLQFPYQTLMYRGGDCDDLSILVCSLLESVGIKTAFITIPGHIFMAFDSGFTVEEAKEYFLTLDEFIVDGNRVWVPLEITLTDEGFNKAWHKGAWEWNTAARNGAAALYKMEDSWKVYKPVNVPGAVARFSLPEETYVARLFSHSVDEFIVGQIMPQIAWYENRIAMNPTAQNYNDFGVLYARYGLFEQAEKQFRLARNLNFLPSVLNTANLYYSMKDYTHASNWYKEVLSYDEKNSLAMIGLARCAYEEGNYKECDYWYGTVFNSDISLARKYSYLGAFESTAGRSFSLADRLENTIWVTSIKEKEVEPAASVTIQVASQTTDTTVKTSKPESPAELLEDITPLVALAPADIEEKNELEPEEEKKEGGDGDDKEKAESDILLADSAETQPASDELKVADSYSEPTTVETKVAEAYEETASDDVNLDADANLADTEIAEAKTEPASTETTVAESEPEVYVGISQELSLNLMSVEDLLALAEDTIIEHGESLDDISLEVDESVDYTKYIEENNKAVASEDLRGKPEDDTRVAEVTTKVAEGATNVADAGSKVAETGSKVAAVATTVADGGSKVTAAAAIVAVANNKVVETDTSVAAADTAATLASADVNVTESDTDLTETDTKDVEADTKLSYTDTAVAEVDTKLAETDNAVVEADTKVAEVATVVAAPDAELAPTDTLADADTTLTETYADLPEADTELATADTKLAVTDTSVKTETNLAELDTDTDESILSLPEAEVLSETKIELAIEKLESKPESSTTSVTTDVPMRAVPRFTVQPSAEWAPESAYTAETIPGMKPFEEEMGNYQNEKAFLYKETEYDFAVNPGEEIKEEEKKDTTIELSSLEVNPFSSFLSEKEAEVIEAITNFKVEETVAEAAKASTNGVDIPLPEVIPQPKFAASVESAVAEPLVEKDTKKSADSVLDTGRIGVNNGTDLRVKPEDDTNEPEVDAKLANAASESADVSTKSTKVNTSAVDATRNTKKTNGIIFAAIGAVAAALAAVFIVKRRKDK